MLAGAPEKSQFADIEAPAINQNPYRQLIRRRFSEPLLLLLIFVFGVWLWDNHVGRTSSPPPDAWEWAMRKADRDLRITEGTEKLPTWLRPMLGIDSMSQTLATTEASFLQLANARHRHHEDPATQALQNEGAYALGVITAIRQKGNPATGPFRQFGLAGPPPPEPILSRVIAGQEYWWDLAYLRGLGLPEAEYAAKLTEARTRQLTNTTIKSRGAILALTLGGLVFIPYTLLAFLRRGDPKHERPVNYAHRWHLGFGLGVFFLAYLASVGFTITFNTGLQHAAPESDGGVSKPLMSMPLFITLDSLTRFLPALIALGLLFRRGRHAMTRLGLSGPLDGKMVLGCFAILQVLGFGLRMTLDRSGPPDPMGGLDASEEGAWGLLYGVLSACIAAPIAEEILYRGVLFRSLANRTPIAPAVILSSVVFALVHFYPMSSLIMIFAVGATCALCYVSSRTLLTAVALHALYNAAIKLPEWIVYHAPLS